MKRFWILLIVIAWIHSFHLDAFGYERWWNYYDKGIFYFKKNLWGEAADAFRMALNQDSLDRKKARTYGMHFIEYYPHRYLGTAYFNLKDWDKAVAELSLALSQVGDSETRKLLDQARQMRALAVSRDLSPPEFTVRAPASDSYVSGLSVVIEGKVSDDVYVGTV